MGNMEKRSRVRASKRHIRLAALAAVQVAGLIALTVAVPNAIGGLAKIGLLPGARRRDTLRRSYQRLVRSGHLRFEGNLLRLTVKGERELHLLMLRQHSRQEKKRWDKKWRVIIFDVPERKKGLREKVRNEVRAIGFVRVQDSVWIYPYDCEDLITLLKADLHIGRELLYMIVDELEGDEWLRKKFGL